MCDISFTDKNFRVETGLNKSDIKFYDAKSDPLRLCGVFYENGRFRRMPENTAKSIGEGVYALHTNTAGGRVRFKTDSPYVAIHAKMPCIGRMGHFTLAGSAGFDLYIKEDGRERYFRSFIPPLGISEGYESVVEFGNADMKEITLNLPLYSDLSELYVGVSEGATVAPPAPYRTEAPIVFYGSSITQGGCASRPGNAYTAKVARALDADHINLGFTGSALAEDAMAVYISGLDMSAFVFDYDHNAPSLEHLQATHEKMFMTVRGAHPEIPIVIMTRPKYIPDPYEEKCRDMIRRTYENAVERGDKNVYFLDGKKLMSLAENDGTVDSCHPNDLGFASMAKAITDILEVK